MVWEAVAHKGFLRDLRRIGLEGDPRIKTGINRLLGLLENKGRPDPHDTFKMGTIVPGVDLEPLRASGIPGSYRLRIGQFRIALAILPDESLVLLTVVTRRDGTSYRNLPKLHRKRFHDR